MKVQYSDKTNKDFIKHREYLTRHGKPDGHKYQKYELDGISKSLKNNISKGLEEIDNHKDSIFPKEFEYNSNSHKMYIDKKSHHVIFYTIEKKKNGDTFIKVQKCIHSTELKKELDKRGIKPLNNCDKSLLKDLETIYKEDDVKLKDDSESDKIEKEDKDENGNPRQHKTGPKGGKYYRVKIDGKWGPWNSDTNESIRNINTIIKESKMMRLVDYIKNRLVG